MPAFLRSRAARLSIAAAVVAAGVLAMAAPAAAHHSVLSGETACYDEEHVVTWSITAMSVVDLPMTIETATAIHDGTTYAVTGYTSPLADETTTTATTVLPAGSTGTVTLHVYSTWPDDVDYTDETSVELEDDCMPTTTTSEATTTTSESEATTTTGEAATTTTEATTTTTTIVVEGSTTGPPFTVPPPESSTTPPGPTVTQAGGPTTVPGAPVGSLPRTGGDAGFPIVFGLCLLGSGALLALRRRGAWSR